MTGLSTTQPVPRRLTADLGTQAPVRWWLVALVTSGLVLAVLVVLFPQLLYRYDIQHSGWLNFDYHLYLRYRLHDISDIPVYWDYATRMGAGFQPYRDFRIEYPPLAVPFFRLPGGDLPLRTYMARFSIEMGAVTLIAGVVVALTACRLWPAGRRAYLAGAAYAAAVALTGAIIVNRYDVVVALVIAVFVLCLVRGWMIAAAIALGIGFALKITPAALLPVVLILAETPRHWLTSGSPPDDALMGPGRSWRSRLTRTAESPDWYPQRSGLWPIVAFAAAAVAGFLPYLITAPTGVWHVFAYHIERPLQIESVLGTPLLVASLFGSEAVTTGNSHGSQSIIGPGSGMLGDLSGFATLAALAVVYLMLLQRRALQRAAPEDLPVAVLALLLAIITFGKVLSPQYFIWLVPVVALVAVRDKLLGGAVALVLILTQVEFPGAYWRLVRLEGPIVTLVIVRNLLLVACFCLAVWRLYGWGAADAERELADGV